MSAQEHRNLIRRDYEEIWNQGKVEVADEIVAEDFVHRDPATPGGVTEGREGYKQLVQMYRTVFSGLHFTLEDVVIEGDRVAVRWTASGTHNGELMGIAPTGKQVTVTGMSMERIANGKIVEGWVNWDALGLLKQIGAIPSAE